MAIRSGNTPPKSSSPVFVGNVTVGETALLLLSSGIRTISNVSAPGVLATDRIEIYPSSVPAGYAVHHAIPAGAGKINVTVSAPALAIGASYSIPCALYAIGR